MSHIPHKTLEIQNAHDRGAIQHYPKLRAALEVAIKAAQAKLDAADDDESEMHAAQQLRESLVELANMEATYRRAVKRQRRRDAEKAKVKA